ncbi:MAG: hypothetical protein H0W11_15840 [Gemmatimonadetes bacterium]|nr:hypothetical protein [Gemmatimonadota bacterium]
MANHPPGRRRRSSPFVGDVVALGLMGLQDFLLFRGPPENVVPEGRFDQSWRVPESEARQLRVTGAVTIGSGSAPTARR